VKQEDLYWILYVYYYEFYALALKIFLNYIGFRDIKLCKIFGGLKSFKSVSKVCNNIFDGKIFLKPDFWKLCILFIYIAMNILLWP